ncbi:zinc finger protein [Macleaya cordata]|uniref:Zinc finger protein n=1 Tax=Macleaya cordata TaxID=56857 RepID=A0A200RBM2_MACCD|nr:zinc finger protein [Macleaya cordata]
MKGRSHRLVSTEPPDDWVNGSWTVDCVCGVTFDDGEEMVNCDECGVWVHTRCSRFVKGETSFSCDKCKNKKNRNDNEETEVAQLLVELTTKTIRMDNLCRPSAPPRPAFRLWTDIPIEDRVHVQGVPGGDPSLFQGLSSVFSSELWKCTGYVPKKFNFQYKEFPCWDEKEELVDARVDEETENPADRGGADVLFSLSKEIVLAKPEAEVSLRGSAEEADCAKKIKKPGGKGTSFRCSKNDVKKEKTHHLTPAFHSGKQKEEFVRSKERSGKKKARSADKEANSKRTASTPSVAERKLEFHEDGGFKVGETDVQDMKNVVRMERQLTEPGADCLDVANDCENSKDESAGKVLTTEHFSDQASRNHFQIEAVTNSEKVNHLTPTRTRCSPKSDAVTVFLTDSNDAGGSLANKEDVNMAVDGLNCLKDENHDRKDLNGSSSSVTEDFQKLNPLVRDLPAAVADVRDNHMLQDSDGGVSLSSMQHDTKVKTEVDDEQPKGDLDLLSFPLNDVKLDPTKHLDPHPGTSATTQPSNKLHMHDPASSSLPSCDVKAQDGDRELEAVGNCGKNETVEGMTSISDEPHQYGQKLGGSAEPLSVKEGSLESKSDPKSVEEPSEIGCLSSSPRTKPDQSKVVLGIGKSSTSSTIVFSRSSFSASSKNPETQASSNALKSIHPTTQRVKTNTYADTKKDHAMIVRDDNRHEAQRKTAKEHTKVYSSSGLKASQTSRIAQASTSKRIMSDSKEQVLIPTSKTSVNHNVAVSSSSIESSGSLHTQSSSHVQNKSTALGFSQKGERSNQSSSHPSSKVNHSPSMHPPAPVNSSPTLSDEELALLLHQELNSSPRVPRVPRVRHGGSLPQLGSPTTTSMLIKRTSSSGAKDQILVSRRKREDASRDGSRNPCELIDETKKKERLPSCSDQRRQDPVCTTNGSSKEEVYNGSPDVVPAKKNVLPASTYTASGGPSSSAEANGQSLSSMRTSPRDISDDDVGAVAGPAPRTLPGLIDEIMSKGKRMSYEELCNAVLPHWHKLRKHNGERYAYSSHSQAVLDCLRNRNEWAQLVDRGPKTNASRKRRKLDSEPPIVEGMENEYDNNNTLTEVEVKYVESQREDFPKGKRKARKRRRLALQGRGIKDVRKRRKADGVMDGDLGPFSQSSEEGAESIFSEDESQGDRTNTVGSEACTSSDETGSML